MRTGTKAQLNRNLAKIAIVVMLVFVLLLVSAAPLVSAKDDKDAKENKEAKDQKGDEPNTPPENNGGVAPDNDQPEPVVPPQENQVPEDNQPVENSVAEEPPVGPVPENQQDNVEIPAPTPETPQNAAPAPQEPQPITQAQSNVVQEVVEEVPAASASGEENVLNKELEAQAENPSQAETVTPATSGESTATSVQGPELIEREATSGFNVEQNQVIQTNPLVQVLASPISSLMLATVAAFATFMVLKLLWPRVVFLGPFSFAFGLSIMVLDGINGLSPTNRRVKHLRREFLDKTRYWVRTSRKRAIGNYKMGFRSSHPSLRRSMVGAPSMA